MLYGHWEIWKGNAYEVVSTSVSKDEHLTK